jgi:hypothetical protein
MLVTIGDEALDRAAQLAAHVGSFPAEVNKFRQDFGFAKSSTVLTTASDAGERRELFVAVFDEQWLIARHGRRTSAAVLLGGVLKVHR